MTTTLEIEQLRRELSEAYETLRAIHEGEVDAFVTRRRGLYRVETLSGADTPYRMFVESMRDGAVTVSPEGVILYCNRPFSMVIGKEASELIGLSVTDWIELDEDLPTLFEQALRAEAHTEGKLRCMTGHTAVAVTVCALPGDDESSVFCLLLTDLSDRIAAQYLRTQQALLARQSAELKAICGRLPFALLLAESADAFSYVNPEAQVVLERYPAVREIASAAATKALTGVRSEVEDISLLSSGETQAMFRVQAIPLTIEDSAPRALVVIEDATLERQAQRARERQEHLREAFVGILGHDLRSPLMTIASAVQLLRMNPDAQRMERAVVSIERAAARMKKLTEDMLDLTLSRIGGGIPISTQSVSLGEVVTATVQELEATAGACFDVALTGDVIGEWDGPRLTQVVTNLLTNAVTYGADGRRVRIVVDGSREDRVMLAVTNEGEPIRSELLPYIFDPFRQGDQLARRKGGGIGLGLYIAERIVAAHGGTIAVESNADEGTTFSVALPRKR